MSWAGLSAQDSSYAWIRQLGGSADDVAVGMAVDSAGNTYVAGTTNSPDFPVKHAIQALPGSAPLYRVDVTGAAKIYSSGASVIVGTAISPCEPRTVYAVSPQAALRSGDLGA